jgi:hypothetical protein
MKIAIAPWVWNTSEENFPPFWDAPEADRCIGGRLDMRSVPECSQIGGEPTARGGLFVYNQTPALLNILDSGEDIPFSKRLDLKNILSITGDVSLSPANTIDFIVWFCLTQADPTGQNRWKPLRGSRKSPPRLILGNQEVWRGKLTDVIKNTIDVFRADYAELKNELSIEQIRKITGAAMVSLFGRMGDNLLEPLLGEDASDGWSKPSTTITESFPGSSDTLGGDLTWTETQGDWDNVSGEGQPQTIGTRSDARAEDVLSSSNHYSQVTVTTLEANASAHEIGPAARFAASARTYYSLELRESSGRFALIRTSSGSRTGINTSITITKSLPEAYKLKVDGTSLDGYQAGTLRVSGTDLIITSGVRCGLYGILNTGGTIGQVSVDNFEASDLEVTPDFLPRILMY